MYDPRENKLVPVPTDRPLTSRERGLTKFKVGQEIILRGVSFELAEIREDSIVLSLVKVRELDPEAEAAEAIA